MPEFERYNRTSCPEAHITMFYRRMTGIVCLGLWPNVQSAESYPNQIIEGPSTGLHETVWLCDGYSA
ncbi:hypothetical protein J1N35_034020 [Gossypium stocksii]|uniref:Uncharacterized protein n=1 Tax=Gossypium stocksii TaxID=47602 RepID=A0A9D3URS1_9ROSI|nr:hypothetical protein J1N35_034020 [Gossypium stocksii]